MAFCPDVRPSEPLRGIIRLPMSDPSGGYCGRCGVRLEPEHRFCWSCGTARRTAPARQEPSAVDLRTLRWLAWLFGAGAIYWLVQVTVSLAYALAPNGLNAIAAQLKAQGAPESWAHGFILTELVVSAVAVGIHAAVYEGLRRRRLWGWVSAVAVSAIYSLALVGIPALYLLLRKRTRMAFGIE